MAESQICTPQKEKLFHYKLLELLVILSKVKFDEKKCFMYFCSANTWCRPRFCKEKQKYQEANK